MVIILKCSPEENVKRLLGRPLTAKSRLSDVDILRDIRQNHFVYRFYDDGYKSPGVWEFELDIESVKPNEAAQKIVELLESNLGVSIS